MEQQFEVKAAKVCEEYLAALLEIHASETNGNQHAHHGWRKVHHEHIASLGSILVPATTADRVAFWRRLS